VRATLRGLKVVMDDPAAASVEYVKAIPQHKGKEKAMEHTFRLYNKYVYPGQKVLGAMDSERLEALQKFYVEQGILRRALPLSDLYTNQFIE
jgi:NitT/TauT family transport system substrate-binding protein